MVVVGPEKTNTTNAALTHLLFIQPHEQLDGGARVLNSIHYFDSDVNCFVVTV